MEDIKANVEAKFRFYKLPKYQHSVFVSLPQDIQSISGMGRIINNSRGSSQPLTIFNPMNFGVYEYSEKIKDYREVKF